MSKEMPGPALLALALSETALLYADQTCPHHGDDLERSGMHHAQPRCESCRQPWRVRRALHAINAWRTALR